MFEKKYHYATVSTAVEQLRKKGFTLDFEFKDNRLVADDMSIDTNDFEIEDLFHYENELDLSDESNVFAITCKNGKKGVLVTGLGMCPESLKELLTGKLSMEVHA